MTPVPCHLVSVLAILAVLVPPGAQAEISVDGTLGGPAGPVSKVDDNYLITEDLGSLRGSNLFHSFDSFDINTGESATFTGPSNVENILSRVTGGRASSIDGTIRSTYPDANLYLMNPRGIMFGPNASLDVQGSFHATTADFIGHSDGNRFNATPASGEILSSARPEAFGFLGNRYSPITIQESRLEVPAGKTLSIIGGDVDVTRNSTDEPTTLVASSGRVNIASVASPGNVVPGADELQMNGFTQLGNLSVRTPDAENAFEVISTSGDPGGSIFIRSGRFIMQDATMTSATLGASDHPGTGIDVHVTGDMHLDRSEIASSSFGDGQAGDLKITAGSLELAGDAVSFVNANIGSRAFAAGDAGDLELNTGQLTVRNNAFINSNTLGSGRGGDIEITSGALEVLGEDGIAFVSTLSANGATGDGGNLEITADNILLQSQAGFTGLTTQVNSTGLGNAGDIHINTGRLDVLDGAEISTAVFNGPGNAGNLVISADTILVSGVNSNDINASVSSSVFWNANGSTTGNGGDIAISTRELELGDKGSITTRNFSNGPGNAGGIDISSDALKITGGSFLSSTRLNLGTGYAGDINIDARDIHIAGPSPENWTTGIFTLASVAASGAGDVNISTGNLRLLDGAVINSRTFGPGAGGTVSITADKVLVAGSDPVTGDPAGIDARTLVFPGFEGNATGRGGNVQIQTGELDLIDSGVITTASSSAGDGGDIVLDAVRINIDSGASVSAESSSTGDAGSIQITVDDNLRLTDGSQINSRTYGPGAGGTVTIMGGKVLVAGRDPVTNTPASIDARTLALPGFEDNATGMGGKVLVQARELDLLDYGVITTASSSAGDGGDIVLDAVRIHLDNGGSISAESSSTGDAGSIRITADESVNVLNDSSISTEAEFSGGGRINIRATDLVYLLDSSITSSVADGTGNGGDITIDPVFVILNSGRILANASSGDGGNILIVTDNFIATPDSVVDASSEFGLDGTVIIKSPVADLNSGLTQLSESFLNVADLLREPCSARRSLNQSSFIVRGQSSIPPGPMSMLPVMNPGPNDTSAGNASAMTVPLHQRQAGTGLALTGLSGPPMLAASLIECGL